MNNAIHIVNLVSSQKYSFMRNFYSKLLFLMLPVLASGQLYVGSGSTSSYVYNKGEIVFVTQDVELTGAATQDEGNLYLRSEGQLIQGDNSANAGVGILSVYQENTRNAWDYHMWTSPVGDPAESTPNNGNSGNARYYMDSNNGGGIYEVVDELSSTAATFSGGYDGKISPLTISTTWLYKYIATQGYSGWSKVNTASPLLPGEGFSMKGVGSGTTPTATSFDFRGRPNNGTIEVSVKANQRTLVGNPYPSAMDLSFYLLSNSGASSAVLANCFGISDPSSRTAVGTTITGEAFFWESDPTVQSHYLADYLGGYGTFTPDASCSSEGTYVPPTYVMYNEEGEVIPDTESGTGDGSLKRRYAPIGQGFFVLGDPGVTGTETVVAKNEFRYFIKESSGTSDFKKPTATSGKSTSSKNYSLKSGELTYDENGFLILPKFTISTVINNKYVRTLKGVMLDEATLGFDRAGDGKNRSDLDSDVNFKIENDNNPYLINLFPYTIDQKLALKIDGANATNTYEIKVTDINFTPDESIYLHDKQTDEYHDILNNSYEFELEKGTYADRYEIVFKDLKTLDVEEVEEIERSFNIYQNNGRAELTVLNPLETELKEINVFDISGRLLVSKLNEGTSAKVTIPSGAWSDGVYIVRVTTRDNIEYSKKVSVKNLK